MRKGKRKSKIKKENRAMKIEIKDENKIENAK